MYGFRWFTPSVAYLIVAVVVVVASVQLLYTVGIPSYSHQVGPDPVDDTRVEDARQNGPRQVEQVVYDYANLSTHARETFLAALHSDDNEVVYRRDDAALSSFHYASDHHQPGTGQYYVRYQGAYYEFMTQRRGSLAGYGAAVLGVPGLVFGVPMVALGLLWHSPRSRLSVSTIVGLGAFGGLSWLGFDWLGATSLWSLLLLGYLSVLVPAVVAWLAYDRCQAWLASVADSLRS